MQIVHKPSKFCIVLFPGIHINDMYFILECVINLLDLSVNMVNRKSISKDIISGNKNHVAFWQLIEVLTGIYSSGRYDNELVSGMRPHYLVGFLHQTLTLKNNTK